MVGTAWDCKKVTILIRSNFIGVKPSLLFSEQFTAGCEGGVAEGLGTVGALIGGA